MARLCFVSGREKTRGCKRCLMGREARLSSLFVSQLIYLEALYRVTSVSDMCLGLVSTHAIIYLAANYGKSCLYSGHREVQALRV
jgi:hypothetical protein